MGDARELALENKIARVEMRHKEESDKSIELFKRLYLLDADGRTEMLELQDVVADHLFNTMGWSGDRNNFADWQEDKTDG